MNINIECEEEVVWNEFIAQTANNGINFSFADLEKRIKETLNEALRQPLVIR